MTTFYRLLGFLRPYQRGLGRLLGAGERAMVMTVALPALTGAAVEAIKQGREHAQHHQTALRAPKTAKAGADLRSRSSAAALVRWGLTVLAADDRRARVAGRSSTTCASGMYGQLQRLELGFFDHQQTGQLMSRATVDLQAVRFFLGYGLVFILQSVLTILLAGVVMIVDQSRARPDRADPGAVRGR